MAHMHPIYDADPHFTIDAITRAITNETGKTILMQYDHDSERFSFEINRLVEGHDVTLCNKVEVHYTNADANRQGVNYGVYEVDDLIVDPDNPDRVVFTWLVSQNATLYAGSLSFLVVFTCVEEGMVVYRWNTNINTSVSIAKGMNNGEAVVEEYPDILTQWKDDLFAAATGTNSIGVGPVEPADYPYIWLDISGNTDLTEKNIGVLTIKGSDGIKQRLYPVVKVSGVEGLSTTLNAIVNSHTQDVSKLNKEVSAEKDARSEEDVRLEKRIDELERLLTGVEVAIAHSLAGKGVDVPANMTLQDVAALIDGITMDIPTALRAVTITTPPKQTEYTPGDTVNTEGMVVTADFGDGATVPVECYIVSPAIVDIITSNIEVTLTVNGVTKTTTYPIAVTLTPASDLPAGSLVSVAETDDTAAWYRIVDTDYYGNVLLVREECLSEKVKYRASNPSYQSDNKYEDGVLDTYLNSTFYESLPQKTSDIICAVDIPVRASAHPDAEPVHLNRHVFALSATEWGYSADAYDGEIVEYTDCRALSVAYWTRQPTAGMPTMAYQVKPDDSCNSNYVTLTNGVRPAFCISKNLSMREIEGGWGITGNSAPNYDSIILTDAVSGTVYKLEVINGDLTMSETLDASGVNHIALIDVASNVIYKLEVNNGKLTMTESTAADGTEYVILVETESNIVHKLEVVNGKLTMS